jgi:hypothetical protein
VVGTRDRQFDWSVLVSAALLISIAGIFAVLFAP